MNELEVGHHILVDHDKFERVYAFAHRDESKEAEFLQFLPSKLELSKDHMVFVQGKGFIPASNVKIGDELSNAKAITSIRTIRRTGVYSPFTPSGMLMVNGVVTSAYVSFQDSNTLKLGGAIDTTLTYHWLAHGFQAPQRLWCHWLGMLDRSYQTNNGYSSWIAMPLEGAKWYLEQDLVVMGLLLVPFLAINVIFVGGETLVMEPVLAMIVIASTLYVVQRASKVRVS